MHVVLRGKISLRRLHLLSVAVTICLISTTIPSSAQRRISGFTKSFGPSAVLRISRPTLVWEVWPGEDCKITSFKLSINGKAVDATYDDTGRRLSFRPSSALAPGNYSVAGDVMIDRVLPMHQEWKFIVDPKAVESLPEPTRVQVAAVESLNGLRQNLNLPPAHCDPALCAAAQAHAFYMATSGQVGHFQQSGGAEFFGATAAERLAAYGFVGSAYESVGYVSNQEADGTIRDLYDAPYHRIPYMQPGNIAAGAGISAKRVALEFSTSATEALVVSPADNQAGVPGAWDGIEQPNPLAAHGKSGPCGYPIVVAWFGGKDRALRDGSVNLQTEAGKLVPVMMNTPATDHHLRDALFAIPEKNLAKGRYRAEAKVVLADGSSRTAIWSFTVAGATR